MKEKINEMLSNISCFLKIVYFAFKLKLTLLSKALLALFTMFSSLTSTDANKIFFSHEIISVQELNQNLPIHPYDSKWSKIKGLRIKVFPQLTLKLNDRETNFYLNNTHPKEVHVKALANRHEIAFWIEWKDSTKSLLNNHETNSYGDGVALEIPKEFGENKRLPYIGMGDEKFPVLIYHQRASTSPPIIKSESMAAGFGSLTRLKTSSVKMNMNYSNSQQMWSATFIRKLMTSKHSLRQGLIPFALSIWDGDKKERGGNKYLSSWKFLKFNRFPISHLYLREMSFQPETVADPINGKKIVETICTSCHQISGNQVASEDFAPNLKGVGGISTYSYLRDSLIKPNEVVVRHLNLYQTSPWYSKDEFGKKVSKMPSFEHLSSQDIIDVISFLKTLEGY